jgi:hypothetical protein
LTKWSKVENISQNLNKRFKTTRTINIYLQKPNLLQKTRRGGGGVKTAVGLELSLVSGNYHEVFGPVVMEIASKSAMFLATLF